MSGDDSKEERNELGQFTDGNTEGLASKYDPSMCEQATKLALLGMTDAEMAKFFGVATSTFYLWMKDHQPFSEAVYAGKEKADAEVAHSLYKKATGITYEVERLRKDPESGKSEIFKLSVYEPPDTAAMKQWLSNRRRRDWSEKLTLRGDEEAPLVHKVVREIVRPKN